MLREQLRLRFGLKAAFGEGGLMAPALSAEGKFALEFDFSRFVCAEGSNVFVTVLKQIFDKCQIFFLNVPKNPRLIFFSHHCNNFADTVPISLHFLMVTATLVRVARDDHVTHHLVNACVLLF